MQFELPGLGHPDLFEVEKATDLIRSHAFELFSFFKAPLEDFLLDLGLRDFCLLRSLQNASVLTK